MDPVAFDVLTRIVSTVLSRRSLVSALGLGALALPGLAGAKKTRKSKIKRNAFGCVNVGGKCRGKDANCCSGICEGKKPRMGEKDTSKCKAHDTGGCQAGEDWCVAPAVGCGPTTHGICHQTTGKASFCADWFNLSCQSCKKDADCEPNHGPGAACIVCPNQCAETSTLCFGSAA